MLVTAHIIDWSNFVYVIFETTLLVDADAEAAAAAAAADDGDPLSPSASLSVFDTSVERIAEASTGFVICLQAQIILRNYLSIC